MSGTPVVLVAACVLIDADDRILIAQRPKGKAMAGLWEFPGGKVEMGERPEETVMREMLEELAISVAEKSLTPFRFASHNYPDFHLLMPLFLCRSWEGVPIPREGQKTAWVRPEELRADNGLYPMPPADLPLVEPLVKLLRRTG